MSSMARQTRDQLRRFRALTEAQAVLGWGAILLLAALVGAIYVNQASRIAAVGRRVQVMQGELEAIKQENAVLEREIAQAQQLSRLQTEAVRLGFVLADPDDIEYLIVPNYPTDVPEMNLTMQPATAVAVPTPPPTINDALWLTLQQRIRGFVQGEANE